MSDEIVTTTCASHCGGSCVLRLHVHDGIVTRIETDGGATPQLRACMRGRAQRYRTYAADRVLHPLRRVGNRGEGKFQRISWDEALDTVAERIVHARDTYGPSSIMYLRMAGDVSNLHNPDRLAEVLARSGGFTEVWGNPSFGGGIYAQWATYGTSSTCNSRDDLPNSRLIIMWGWNPAVTVSGVNTAWYLARAKEEGAGIVAVDPRYTDSAAVFADRWIPIRPGTDGAMLLAMAYVMIVEGLCNQSFLDRYAVGFEDFKRYVIGEEDSLPKSPGWAESVTDVSASAIETLAREYATIKPAALMTGIAPGRTAFGEQYHRIAITLACMTGNVGIHGGSAGGRVWESIKGGYPYRISRSRTVSNPVDEAVPDPPPGWYPGYRSSRVHYCDAADAILKGRAGGYPADFRLLAVVNSSYVGSFANVNKVVRALKAGSLEFTFVVEQFMTATARLADVVLPASTFLERSDIVNGVGVPFYGYAAGAVEAVGEGKSHLEIASLLARRLGVTAYDGGEAHRLREMGRDSEIPDYEEFRREGVCRIRLGEPYVAFQKEIEDPANHPFPTPSGKIEIHSGAWAGLDRPDLPPVPMYMETWESLSDSRASAYPLQMISSHFRRRANAQFENIPLLKELERQAVLINPLDAVGRGICDGDLVRVFNDRGAIVLPARVTERIRPGVVDVPHGGWYDPDNEGVDRGGCPNVLTRDGHSPGFASPYGTCLVQVRGARSEPERQYSTT